jgi:hypothetical protein
VRLRYVGPCAVSDVLPLFSALVWLLSPFSTLWTVRHPAVIDVSRRLRPLVPSAFCCQLCLPSLFSSMGHFFLSHPSCNSNPLSEALIAPVSCTAAYLPLVLLDSCLSPDFRGECVFFLASLFFWSLCRYRLVFFLSLFHRLFLPSLTNLYRSELSYPTVPNSSALTTTFSPTPKSPRQSVGPMKRASTFRFGIAVPAGSWDSSSCGIGTWV